MTEALDFSATFARLANEGQSEAAAQVGGVRIRMVRVAAGSTGKWDSHANTNETAMVWSGDFTVEFRDRTLALSSGQCCVVPVGADHRASSNGGAEVVLFTQA